MTTTEFAPAKINLALHVTGQRGDGYHLLESLVVFADVGDEITVAKAPRDSFAISGPFAAGLSNDANNLVIKARNQLRKMHEFGPVNIVLRKNLPIASGIGGGSSDAAATLRAIAKHYDIPAWQLANIGLGLGADVPMCLTAKPLVASGIGENLSVVRSLPELHLVLVNPNVAIATPDVFRRLSNRSNPALPALPDHLNHADFAEWLSRTRNDLQLPALQLCPQIGDALIALAESGAMLTRMSGSGATCFGLFQDAGMAESAALAIAARFSNWWVQPVAIERQANGN